MEKHKAAELFNCLERMRTSDAHDPMLKVRLEATLGPRVIANSAPKREWKVRAEALVPPDMVRWQDVFAAASEVGAEATLQNAGVEFS